MLMDSDNFALGKQGDNNTNSPDKAPAQPVPAPAASAQPVPAPAAPAQPVLAPVAPAQPVSAPVAPATPAAPVPEASTTSMPVQPASDALAGSSVMGTLSEKPKKSLPSKQLMIISGFLLAVVLVAVLVFLIPFGEKTLWQLMTGGNGSGGSGGGSSTSQVVKTGGYTYTTNLDLEYEPSGYFHEGLLAAKDSDGNIVYLNTAGEVAFKLDPQYRIAGDFSDGLMPVKCGGAENGSYDDYGAQGMRSIDFDTYGYVNKAGELVIPCQYSDAEEFSNGYAAVSIEKDDPNDRYSYERVYWGVIDTSGNNVVDYIYEYIQAEDGMFKDEVFEANKYTDGRYIDGCFDFSGNLLEDLSTSYGRGCISDPQAEENKKLAESFEEKIGERYIVSNFNEGLAAVYSFAPLEFYFINTDGDRVWTLDINKVVDVDEEEYQEGLFLAFMWVGDEAYPGVEQLETMMRKDELFIYRNSAAVYYDHSGNPVFMYRYAKSLPSLEKNTEIKY